MTAVERAFSVVMLDDDPEDIYTMRRAFGDCAKPFDFIGFNRAPEFFDHLSGAHTDVVLLDLNMHRPSGFEVLEQIRADAVVCYLPVLILTTSEEAADAQHALSLGANAVITKSASLADARKLANAIHSFWGAPGLMMPRADHDSIVSSIRNSLTPE